MVELRPGGDVSTGSPSWRSGAEIEVDGGVVLFREQPRHAERRDRERVRGKKSESPQRKGPPPDREAHGANSKSRQTSLVCGG